MPTPATTTRAHFELDLSIFEKNAAYSTRDIWQVGCLTRLRNNLKALHTATGPIPPCQTANSIRK